MLRVLLLSFAALAGCGESAPPAPAANAGASSASPTIPALFHGEWNASLADCGTAANASRLRIAADRITFHESSGTVASVTVHSESEISVEAALSGEGTSWRSTRRWRLSPDGVSLEDVTEGAGLVRRRCP